LGEDDGDVYEEDDDVEDDDVGGVLDAPGFTVFTISPRM
jgi:hypothetical protein